MNSQWALTLREGHLRALGKFLGEWLIDPAVQKFYLAARTGVLEP